MDDLTRAIAAGTDPDVAIGREVLRAAVQRTVFCPHSGVVLDVETTVLITVTGASGPSGSQVVDAAVWDAVASQVHAACVAKGLTLEVIDGRTLTSRSRGRRCPQEG